LENVYIILVIAVEFCFYLCLFFQCCSKFWAELFSYYEKLFETEIEYDVTYAGEEQNVKEIHAHSLILSTRSQYFRTASDT
jgi:hypothetical protein